MTEKAFHVSWDQFHRDARALAWRLSGPERFSGMVAITRGGWCRRDRRARARYADHRYILRGELRQRENPGRSQSSEKRYAETARDAGEGLLVIDDLADTGATVKLIRAVLPKAHVATVYAKPLGRPLVDTFITEVSQDTWIYFPWTWA